MRRWLVDEDLWVRRSVVLSQVGHKADADEGLLFEFCLARAHETDFFMRKAIGWALREHGKVRPEAVACFVETHRAKLSPLTIAEAMKNLTDDSADDPMAESPLPTVAVPKRSSAARKAGSESKRPPAKGASGSKKPKGKSDAVKSKPASKGLPKSGAADRSVPAKRRTRTQRRSKS